MIAARQGNPSAASLERAKNKSRGLKRVAGFTGELDHGVFSLLPVHAAVNTGKIMPLLRERLLDDV
jgi:hypothetical protein